MAKSLAGPILIEKFSKPLATFCASTPDLKACIFGGRAVLGEAVDSNPASFESAWGKTMGHCFARFKADPDKLIACDKGSTFAANEVKKLMPGQIRMASILLTERDVDGAFDNAKIDCAIKVRAPHTFSCETGIDYVARHFRPGTFSARALAASLHKAASACIARTDYEPKDRNACIDGAALAYARLMRVVLLKKGQRR